MSIPSTPSGQMGKLLASALRFWLRSQTEGLDRLEINISGKNRQILTGYLPKVALTFAGAIYQGLHLTQGWTIGENIRINLGQVLQGKPLKILEPITVTAEILIQEADLSTSLKSALLSTALNDLFFDLVTLPETDRGDRQAEGKLQENWQINWQNSQILPEEIVLTGQLTTAEGHVMPVSLRSGLEIVAGSQLNLSPLAIETAFFPQTLDRFSFDLGSEVNIQALKLSEGQLFIQGKIMVQPPIDE